jgi:hypothetical protein
VNGAALDDVLVAELARTAVERAAPEELPLFRPTSEAFFADPTALERREGRDDMLGFGVDSALVLLTPVALAVARDVVDFVVAQVRSRLHDEGESAVQGALDRLFRRGDRQKPDTAAAEADAELTDEELGRVRTIALEKARQLRLSPDRAVLLADAIVGGLATA